MARLRSSPWPTIDSAKGVLPPCGQRDDRQIAAARVLCAKLPCEPRAHVLGERRRIASRRNPVGDAFKDGRQVADRHPLGEKDLQHALDPGDGDLCRHDVLEEFALLLRQLPDELLHLAVG
jgi:hypothetical protein